ncbi:DUF4430 domain-containing protein [Brevibacillus laterosporus]|uniref:DUF4430 domain-containing protein n=1 Tax=Brevibacillus laterosporus TaxID=1465 RepID=UPI000E6D30CA|nr:DUF4430 domain-containing protein [Brevibacillus laterosporus]AYB37872.1 DUF4430 domain-containing protein [Brevibacillus laterosporus]MBM7109467.1 hypothetical protein [Brevibacillus laterosporus]
MLKKVCQIALLVALAMVSVIGCSKNEVAQNTAAEEKVENKVVVQGSTDQGKTDQGKTKDAEKTIQFKGDQTLYELMKTKFKVEDDNGFITSIEVEKQNGAEKKYRLYEVDGAPGVFLISD